MNSNAPLMPKMLRDFYLFGMALVLASALIGVLQGNTHDDAWAACCTILLMAFVEYYYQCFPMKENRLA